MVPWVSHTCSYDAWNRLVSLQEGANVEYVFAYDGLGRRVMEGMQGVSYWYRHFFCNSSWQTLETRFTSTQGAQPETIQPYRQYVWSARYIDSPVLRDKNTDEDGLCDDERLYYLTDANFNVTALVDTAGDAVERYLYDPYGKLTTYDGTWDNTRSGSSYLNEILYTGREYHSNTGLYYYRNRYYHTGLGRFLSRDPIGYQAGDSNLYRYVGNRGVNAADPTGCGRLGKDILSRYAFRVAVAGSITGQLGLRMTNALGWYDQVEDDGHVAKASRKARDEFFINLAKSLGVQVDCKWYSVNTNGWQSVYPHAKQRFTLDEEPGVPVPFQASFWLGGMHDFEGNGTYKISLCCPDPDRGITLATIRSVSMDWRWVDMVDAHSVGQYDWAHDSAVQGFLETFYGDALGDKILSAGFWIHVNFNDTESRERYILGNGELVPPFGK
jgi:RHS repeat-associated protein